MERTVQQMDWNQHHLRFFSFIQLASSEPLHVNFFLKKYHATAKY